MIGPRPRYGVSIPCETTALLLRLLCSTVASPPNGLASLPMAGQRRRGAGPFRNQAQKLRAAPRTESRGGSERGARPQAGQSTGRGALGRKGTLPLGHLSGSAR